MVDNLMIIKDADRVGAGNAIQFNPQDPILRFQETCFVCRNKCRIIKRTYAVPRPTAANYFPWRNERIIEIEAVIRFGDIVKGNQ